jgi:4-aminobutyrate aminotransferase-like enzyme
MIGTPAACSGWPPSAGEAMHTSTFLGNPAGCAAALAQLAEIERLGLLDRAAALGRTIEERAADWQRRGLARGRAGRGLLQGISLWSVQQGAAVCAGALQKGVILLTEGDGDVLALTPPAVITDAQLDFALGVIEALLAKKRVPGAPISGS